MLLKNDGGTLPVAAAPGAKVAVVGPLSNSVFEDLYSGTLPYAVTPLQGITERLGSRGTVAAAEGDDRIALKEVTTGRYVTAGTGAGGATLTASAATAGTEQGFDLVDWGQGVTTLRAAANTRYVTLGDGRTLINNQTQPNGWFVEQQFKLQPQTDGTVVLEYAGYEATESWFGPNKYVTVDADGKLGLGAATPEAAATVREGVGQQRDRAGRRRGARRRRRRGRGRQQPVHQRPRDRRPDLHRVARRAGRARQGRPAGQPATRSSCSRPATRTTITWAQEHVPAILWTTHAGQETGHALADVLFGDYNPTGRLTQTWYRSDADLPDILDYDISKTGATYLYYQGSPLYPFGHGLSYTSFRYSNPRVSTQSVTADGKVTVSVAVTNTGRRAGTEVVQLYSHQRRSRASGQPVKQLRTFGRVTLAPGQTTLVRLTLNARDLAFWDVTRSRSTVESGRYDLMIGSSAGNTPLSVAVDVRGETIPPRDLTGRSTLAATFDDYSGVTLVDATRADGTAVAATGPGQWIKFGCVELGSGVGGIAAQVSNAASAPTTIQVRLDNPTSGRLLGTVTVPSTGDRRTWVDQTAALQRATGRHDIYLVFTGPAAVNTVQLSVLFQLSWPGVGRAGGDSGRPTPGGSRPLSAPWAYGLLMTIRSTEGAWAAVLENVTVFSPFLRTTLTALIPQQALPPLTATVIDVPEETVIKVERVDSPSICTVKNVRT